MTSLPFHEVCATRQRVCLSYLDRIIASNLLESKNMLVKYNKLERFWEIYDRRHGNPHETFLKMNNNFRMILNDLVDERIVKFLISQQKKLSSSKNKRNISSCVFCFDSCCVKKEEEDDKKEKENFICCYCKNSCHMFCIMEWLGQRINQACPFCRILVLQ